MAGCAPLLVADLRAAFHRDVVATDASTLGLGVCAATPPGWLVDEAALIHGKTSLPPRVDRDDLPPALQRVLDHHWRTIVASPVRFPGSHINSLEGAAAVLGLRWALSTPSTIGSRVLLLSDSSVIVSALAKGRSSSRVAQAARRFAALQLAAAVRVTLVWIPTDKNPADSPSRLFGRPSSS
jgi:hypothetical protein